MVAMRLVQCYTVSPRCLVSRLFHFSRCAFCPIPSPQAPWPSCGWEWNVVHKLIPNIWMFAHFERSSVHRFINAVNTGLALLRGLLPIFKHVVEDTDSWFFLWYNIGRCLFFQNMQWVWPIRLTSSTGLHGISKSTAVPSSGGVQADIHFGRPLNAQNLTATPVHSVGLSHH